MRHLIIIFAIIILILVPAVVMAQINWERYPNAVIDIGAEGNWDDVHVSHPSVFFDGSEYHMWYTGDNGSQRGIGYAKSADGKIWEEYPGNPVLTDGIGDVWDGELVSQPCVRHDGTQYRMWYAGCDGSSMRIGYATSSDGITWAKHASNPVIDLSTWDAAGVSNPTVLYNGTQYQMWYTGYDGGNMRIGYATSDDGIVWIKPLSEPVIDLEDSWDSEGCSSPTVVLTDEPLGRQTYRMWYSGYDGNSMRIGYATSSDGINWTKHASNPVFDLGDDGSSDSLGVSSPAVVFVGSTYRIWHTGYDGAHLRICSADSKMPGDISGDGTISAADAGLILKFVVGMIDEFPSQQLTAPDGIQMLQSYRVSLPQISAKEGERIYVPLTIQDATGLFAGGVRLEYDPTVLRALEVSPLGMLSGSYWQSNIHLYGEVRFGFAALNPLKEGGNLFILTFEVLPNTEGRVTPLTFSEVEFNNVVPLTKLNGSVLVLPSTTRILPNYPNPFNPETWIPYQIASDSHVRIRIYNVLGQLVRTLDLGEQKSGFYLARGKAAYWDGRNSLGQHVASSVYFYQFQADDFTAIRRMILVK